MRQRIVLILVNFDCQFIVKNDPERPPHLVRGFFTFQCFVFFPLFAFSCLGFSSFPLLLDFLKPKSGPSNDVTGINMLWYDDRMAS